MMLPILIACFLIFSLASGDDITKSKRLRCGSRAMELPPHDQPQIPRPHFVQEDQPFVPYKILYMIDDTIGQDEIAKLKMATDYANGKISKMIKARKVADVRFRNPRRPLCPELCDHMPFPTEFVLPCTSTSISEPTIEIKKLNEANYTLVVRVFWRDQGVLANNPLAAVVKGCDHNTIAFARSCLLLREELNINQGPHHGFVVLCHQPSSMTNDYLRDLVLHETLHVLMPYSLSGIVANVHNCERKPQCKNITWKEVKRQAKNEQGHPVEITAGIAIGPLYQKAAQDHFGCDTVEGVELNIDIFDRSGMDTEIDHLHWSEHLFPDEVMAPYQSTISIFSNLTLSALASHVKWYKVDQSQAEPLVTSKPSKEFACDVANKGCFEILQAQSGKGVKFIRPLCDDRQGTDRVIVSHCSSDHQRQLNCRTEESNSRCAFLMATNDDMYDHEVCANTTMLRPQTLASHVGASFGPGTICVTTTSVSPWESHKTNALCLHHECHEDSLILKFKPTTTDDPDCYISCTKGQSNQLLTRNWCNKAEHEVTIICPDFEQVCKKETTTTATISTVPKTTTAPPTSTSTFPTSTTTSSATTTTSTESATISIVSPTRSSIPTAISTDPPISTGTVPAVTSTAPKPAPIASSAASFGIQILEILVSMFWFGFI